MLAYFLAPSLVSLRDEVNRAHPNRDKSSDGWIGDASHAARVSDHNPDYSAGGIVRAIDITHNGIDKGALLWIAAINPRTEYIIQDWKIYTRQAGFKAAPYYGTNGHTKHTHVSISHTADAARPGPWGYGAPPAPPAQAPWGSGKPISVVAREVIHGEWGIGQDRINRLRAALYDPAAVQAAVNRLLR